MKKTVLNLRKMGFVLVAATSMLAFSCGGEEAAADAVTDAVTDAIEEGVDAAENAMDHAAEEVEEAIDAACDMGDIVDTAAAAATEMTCEEGACEEGACGEGDSHDHAE